MQRKLMEELAPRLVGIVEEKITLAITEKFMIIQQRVDNNAN